MRTVAETWEMQYCVKDGSAWHGALKQPDYPGQEIAVKFQSNQESKQSFLATLEAF